MQLELLSVQTPLNINKGQSGIIYVVQDNTGSNTISFSDVWKTSKGGSVNLTTRASAVDAISYFVRGVSAIDIAAIKDFR